MKMMLKCLALVLAITMNTAYAQNTGLFYGVHIGELNLKFDDGTKDENTSLIGQVGYQFNSFLGAEIQASVASDEISSAFREPLARTVSLLGRVGYEWQQISTYALLGYTSLDSDSGSDIDSDGGLAYGLELNLFGSPSTALSFKYMNHDDGTASVIGIGFVHFFNTRFSSFTTRHPSKN